MSYRVVAPLVIAEDQAGKLHHVYEGGVIPWLSDAQAQHFLSESLVEKVGADTGPVLTALDPDAASAQPDQHLVVSGESASDDSKPLRAAPKADWVDYAVANGADPDEAEALNKSELIDLYGG